MFLNRPAANQMTSSPATAIEMVNQDGGEYPGGITPDAYFIRDKVQRKLLAESESEVNRTNISQLRQMIEVFFNQVLAEENLLYTRANRNRILEWVVADILGYGPLEPLLNDPIITEVMVNGPKLIFVERYGKIEKTDISFENEAHLIRVIDRIVSPLGRRVDEASPMVDARLPNGYRVNATIPPLSLDGPLLTIRKFAQTPFTATDLIANGTLSAPSG